MCSGPSHLNVGSASEKVIGTCTRPTLDALLVCFGCEVTKTVLDRMKYHVQEVHNDNRRVTTKATFHALSVPSVPPALVVLGVSREVEVLKSRDHSSAPAPARGLDSDSISGSSIRPLRGRRPHPHLQTLPYPQVSDDGSQSVSLTHQGFEPLTTESPLTAGFSRVPSPLR